MLAVVSHMKRRQYLATGIAIGLAGSAAGCLDVFEGQPDPGGQQTPTNVPASSPTADDGTTGADATEEPGLGAAVAKLLASDGERADHFGTTVSISGDTALVGAFNRYGGRRPGAAYVFVRSGGTWIEQAKLAAPGAPRSDRFAETLCLDGDTAVIGAPGDDETGPNAGAAYVFVRDDSTWRQQAKLTHTPEGDDRFGTAVSVSGDTALVGAYRSPTEKASFAGAAYVFTRSGETWSQRAKLYASDGHSSAYFGRAVSIDGNTALVGASGDSGAAETAGAGYVFTGSGGAWSEQAKLVASDAEADNGFGFAVDVDGDTAIVGVRSKEDRGVKSLGAAYVFARSGTSWSQQTKLSPDDLEPGTEWGELFGKQGVGIDGDTAVVAAAGSTEAHEGKAYVYDRNDTTWTRRTILVESDPIPYEDSAFASSIGIDGNSVVVGAPGHDETAPSAGAAFVFGV
jgi:hypothetical protein